MGAASRKLPAPDAEFGELLDELTKLKQDNAELAATIRRQEQELSAMAELRTRLERLEAALGIETPQR